MKNDALQSPVSNKEEFVYVALRKLWSVEDLVKGTLNSTAPFSIEALRVYTSIDEACLKVLGKKLVNMGEMDKVYLACGLPKNNPYVQYDFPDFPEDNRPIYDKGLKLNKGYFHCEQYIFYTKNKKYIFTKDDAKKAAEKMEQKKSAEKKLYTELGKKIEKLSKIYFSKPNALIETLKAFQNQLPNEGSPSHKYNFESLQSIIKEKMENHTNSKLVAEQLNKYPDIKKLLDDAVETDKKYMEFLNIDNYEINNYSKLETPALR